MLVLLVKSNVMYQAITPLNDNQIAAVAALVAQAKQMGFCRETLQMVAENYLRQAEKEPDEMAALLRLAASLLMDGN